MRQATFRSDFVWTCTDYGKPRIAGSSPGTVLSVRSRPGIGVWSAVIAWGGIVDLAAVKTRLHVIGVFPAV